MEKTNVNEHHHKNPGQDESRWAELPAAPCTPLGTERVGRLSSTKTSSKGKDETCREQRLLHALTASLSILLGHSLDLWLHQNSFFPTKKIKASSAFSLLTASWDRLF